MNIKDRLAEFVKNKQSGMNTITEYENIESIFENDKFSIDILHNYVKENKNIFLICSSNCDKTISCRYLYNFYKDKSLVEETDIFKESLKYSNSQTVIITNPDGKDFIKALEYMLFGQKSFVLAFNFKTYEDILESLIVWIAINGKNLTNVNIVHLLKKSEAVLVYIDRNEDGLFSITDISEIICDDNGLNLKQRYNSRISKIGDDNLNSEREKTHEVVFEENFARQEKQEVVLQTTQNIPQTETQIKETLPVREELFGEIIKESGEIAVCQEKNLMPKINKYKLLKEKIHNKNSKNINLE